MKYVVKQLSLLLLYVFSMPVVLLGQEEEFIPHADAVAYIQKYKLLAMEEMERVGIPAAITLAQGLLESGFGKSELANKSNNHFGIKCKKEWAGQRVYHDDDAKGECFRKYPSTKSSYIDHSNFLVQKKRYKKLFSHKITDYKSWAHGLKKAGYATNPKYAEILIHYIENYQLHQYTPTFWARYKAQQEKTILAEAKQTQDNQATPIAIATSSSTNLNKPLITAKLDTLINIEEFVEIAHGEGAPILLTQNPEELESNKRTVKKSALKIYDHFVVGKTISINNVPVICLPRGVSLFELAQKQKIPLSSIYRYNDLTFQEYKNDILQQKMLIYLAPKKRKGDAKIHTMRDGESLHDISQLYGIKLKKLLRFNRLKLGETPIANGSIYLQEYAPSKPNII